MINQMLTITGTRKRNLLGSTVCDADQTGWFCLDCDRCYNVIIPAIRRMGMSPTEWAKNQYGKWCKEKQLMEQVKREVREEATGGIAHRWICISLGGVSGEVTLTNWKKVMEGRWGLGGREKGIISCWDKHTKVSETRSLEKGKPGNWAGHYHLHILSLRNGENKNYKWNRIQKELAKMFGVKPNFVKGETGNPELFEQRYKYILGLKCEEKKKYVNWDRKWRSSLSLPQFLSTMPKKITEKMQNHHKTHLQECSELGVAIK